jgi:hypothetical protein
MSFSPRQRRWLAISVGVFVVFTVVGFLVAPPILKAQLVKRLGEELGRPVTIRKIRLNPYALSLTIEGLAIRDRDGGPFVGWRRVYVNFDSASFFVREWRFQEIAASAPELRVIVNRDGSFNFSDFLTKLVSPPVAAKPAPGTPAWPLRVASLAVSEAALDLSDRSRSADFATRVGPVSFSLRDFHTSPGDGAPYQFEATTESGENLKWKGTLAVAPLGSQGEFSLGGIRLPKYAPYYRDLVRFDLTGGSLDVGGRYEIDLSGAKPRAKLSAGTVHLTGFRIAAREGKNALFEVDDLSVVGIEADSMKLSAAVEKVALTGGRVSASRSTDGAIDLVSLLTPVPVKATPVNGTASPAANSAPPPTASAPANNAAAPQKPDLKIADFAVRKFALTFEDHATPRAALNTIENAEFDAKNLTLAEGAPIAIRANVTLPNQGSAKIDGTVVLSPLTAELDVEVANLAIASVSPYVEPMVNLRIAAGRFSSKGRARFELPAGVPAPRISFKGDVSVADFLTVAGPTNDEFSKWSALAIAGIDVASEPLTLSVNEITWIDPGAHLIVNRDGTNNLASILKTEAKLPIAEGPVPPVAAPTASAPLPKITVGKVTISNGAFTFTDRSLEPAVNMAINQFSGTIAGLSSENLAKADVELKATVDGAGPVSITGKLDPLGAEKFVDVKVDFKNVDLTPFSPYSGRFAGYELARGKLFLDVTAKLAGNKVDMQNVVTVNQFTFGAATNSPDATKLPVRLGVALLKDTDGKMVIDIPVAGSLGDPEFRIGRVVWRVIGNLLTKAATSPFSLLGSMFGGGGEELAFQEFGAGESEMVAGNLPKLVTLTKALAARPGLNLEIAGSFDAAADGFALKKQFLAKQVRASAWEKRRAMDPNLPPPDQLVVSAEEESAIIQKMFAEKFPPGTEFGAPLPVAPPPSVAAPPPKRTLLGRVVALFTAKPRDPAKVAESTPAAVRDRAVASASEGSLPAGPSMEEMKLRLSETIEITDEDLRQLAATRAKKIREYFLEAKIAPERLFLGNEAAVQGPRVILQLQ